MVQAQSEKTWLKTGYCPYCGKPRTFEVQRKDVSRETLSSKAFYECDCPDAVDARRQRLESAKYFNRIGRNDLAKQVLGA